MCLLGGCCLGSAPRGGKAAPVCFLVKKKSGAQRIIFDTRVANCRFVDPPSTRLPSPSAFASLEAEGGPVYVASGDRDVAFYHMQLPKGMEHMFSLPCIDSSYLQKFHMPGVPDGAGVAMRPRVR
eukprot:8593112-Pyramimonas_sp.AAC.1